MRKDAGPKSCARGVRRAFRDLHDSVRRVGLSQMQISGAGMSFDLKDRHDSSHEKLKRHVAIEEMKRRMEAFRSFLAACFSDRDVAVSLRWSYASRPEYVLSTGGRRILDGGKAAMESALEAFVVAAESGDDEDRPRARRALITHSHQDWLTLVREGRPVMGCLADRFGSFDLWNDVSEVEAWTLFDQKIGRARNAAFIGPVVASAVARDPGSVLQSDRAMPGHIDRASPLATRILTVARDIYAQDNLLVILEAGLREAMTEILGARGVRSVDISILRRPECEVPWSFERFDVEGGSRKKHDDIDAAATVLCVCLERVLHHLGALDLVDARVDILAERTGRDPIEKVSLRCQVAGAKSEFEMDWRGVMTGRNRRVSGSEAVDSALASIAVAADLCKDGEPGLYVAVHTSGSPWTARPYWAASATHAAWLELDGFMCDGMALNDPEIAAYPLDLQLLPPATADTGDQSVGGNRGSLRSCPKVRG